MVCANDFFAELHDVSSKMCVKANYSVSPVKVLGVAKILLLDKRCVSRVLSLGDCLYVPDDSPSLSLSAFGQKSLKMVFDNTCELRCSDKNSFSFVQWNGFYETTKISVCFSNISGTFKTNLDLWYCRLGGNNGRCSKVIKVG